MDPHRIHHDIFEGPKRLEDPGDGKSIRVTEDLNICELVSATAETRTLDDPLKPGIRLLVRMLTDGGTIVLYAANGLDVQLDTHATFADADDLLELISVTKTVGEPPFTGVYRWQVLDSNIGVSLE